MKLDAICWAMEQIAPTRFAESWDNVGLLVGDREHDVRHALLCIDYTREVAAERKALGADLVVAYHPPLFQATKRVLAGSVAFDAVRDGVAIYSPHTAWDIAEGGVNDFLADVLGMGERSPLKSVDSVEDEYKLVAFIPHDAVARVMDAVFAAGAGRVGNYSSCSFRSPGEGTFFGEAESRPAVGARGVHETVQEMRVECVVPTDRAAGVVRALRAAHPYEEPAFDLLRVVSRSIDRGLGRVGRLHPTSRKELIETVKAKLGVRNLLVAGPTDGTVTVAAVAAGSGGELLSAARAQGAELFLTGEVRHHDALRAAAQGMTVVSALHSGSERASLSALQGRLGTLLTGVRVTQSTVDRDPFVFV